MQDLAVLRVVIDLRSCITSRRPVRSGNPGTGLFTVTVRLARCLIALGHYHRHRFPAEVIAYAVLLYYRFPLSHRDVEEMLSYRGMALNLVCPCQA